MGTLSMKIGPLLGEHLLEIAQTNISKGNVEYGANVYINALCGFTKEYTMMLLKNEAVLITDEDGTGVNLVDDPELIKKNAHNIFDWNLIINKRLENIIGLRKNLIKTNEKFLKYYRGDILDYSMLDMMKRYYTDEEMNVMSGTANIAARICGDAECKICDKGSSNPWSAWKRLEGRVESDEEMEYDKDIHKYYLAPAKWEKILYYTVRYNKLIRLLHKEYLNFENTYFFLVENGFIERPNKIEITLENTIKTLVEFADDSKGYYHPLCNTGLYEYKNKLHDDIVKTRVGKEYCQNGIIKTNIMDGYDAGWLSPDGEFYGADGDTSALIHMNLAEDIFNGNNAYANQMAKDGVSVFGGTNSPDYWLESHGWVKIHHNDCYGAFIGRRNEEPTKEFPYAYNPTEIQIKMICDYADKFYGGKFYTEANLLGQRKHLEPFTTYKVRQMDDLMIHEIFRR